MQFLIFIVSQSDYIALRPAVQIIRKQSCYESPHNIKLTTMNGLLYFEKNNSSPSPHWTKRNFGIRLNSVICGQVCSTSLSRSNWNSLGCKAGLHLAQCLC